MAKQDDGGLWSEGDFILRRVMVNRVMINGGSIVINLPSEQVYKD